MYASLSIDRPAGLCLRVIRSDETVTATLSTEGAGLADPSLAYAVAEPQGCYVSQDAGERYSLWVGRASFAVSAEDAARLRDRARIRPVSLIGDASFERAPTASAAIRDVLRSTVSSSAELAVAA